MLYNLLSTIKYGKLQCTFDYAIFLFVKSNYHLMILFETTSHQSLTLESPSNI